MPRSTCSIRNGYLPCSPHERQAIQAEHAALQAKVASPTSVEHSLIGKVAQQMLRRAIQLSYAEPATAA